MVTIATVHTAARLPSWSVAGWPEERSNTMSHVVTIEDPKDNLQGSQYLCRERSRPGGYMFTSRTYDFLYGKGCSRPSNRVVGQVVVLQIERPGRGRGARKRNICTDPLPAVVLCWVGTTLSPPGTAHSGAREAAGTLPAQRRVTLLFIFLIIISALPELPS